MCSDRNSQETPFEVHNVGATAGQRGDRKGHLEIYLLFLLVTSASLLVTSALLVVTRIS